MSATATLSQPATLNLTVETTEYAAPLRPSSFGAVPQAAASNGHHAPNAAAIASNAAVSLPRVLLVEDDAACTAGRSSSGEDGLSRGILVQVHSISGQAETLGSKSLEQAQADGAEAKQGRAGAALHLLDLVPGGVQGAVVIASAVYGCSRHFLAGLAERGCRFAVELRPATLVQGANSDAWVSAEQVSRSLSAESWQEHRVTHPLAKTSLLFHAADAGEVCLQNGRRGRLIVAHTGGVSREAYRGTIFSFTDVSDVSVSELLKLLPWTRWIRPYARRAGKARQNAQQPPAQNGQAELELFADDGPRLVIRSNIAVGRQRDRAAALNGAARIQAPALKGELGPLQMLNTVELFAGAGGMGLGFLMARQENRRFRIVYSGEIEPIYARTLEVNHQAVRERHPGQELVPHGTAPVDLAKDESLEAAVAAAEAAGGAHVVVGGPPCQGFSASNRNSWSSSNPNNRLVDVYLRYVERLQPRVFLMENVQGILWTSKSEHGGCSVALDLQRRMERAGYLVFPQLLDAVWYGVPQHRTRYFLMGIHRDLGYNRGDFDPEFGPFPQPTHGPRGGRPWVTVQQAIGDLPPIGNGHREEQMPWTRPRGGAWNRNPFLQSMRAGASADLVTDHITSSHAPYVLERYAAIPEGGNWQSIQDLMTNYAAIERTHSNIYRRLRRNEPAITMGHYRKSMLIHPSQHRGLSLREAMRLQSFPDWFRFAGSAEGVNGGLMHKQQQLANAVCPLVLQAVAEEILKL